MYTLRLPFELPEGYQINYTDKPILHDGLEFKLKKESRSYVLIVKEFASEEDANKFIINSWAGLMWVLLNCGLAPKWGTKPQKITYAKDQVEKAKNLSKSFDVDLESEIHGFIDGSDPAIFVSEGNYRVITAGNANLILGINSKQFFEYFFTGIESHNLENGYEHKKLGIALELYGAFFFEATPNAKFLTLVMVLEALAESEKRPRAVLDLLENFRNQIVEIENNYSEDTEEKLSLESLKHELIYRREESKRKQVHSLVFNTLSKNGDSDALDTAKRAQKVYDKRSTLVHQGSLASDELGKVSADAKEIVERVLKAKFKQIVEVNYV